MSNDSRLGLFAGLGVFLIVAVFFSPKSLVGPAAINNGEAATTTSPTAMTTPVAPSASANATTHTIWQPQEPREVKPVSRDPLLWP